MKKFKLPSTEAPVEIRDLLFIAWVQSLASQQFALHHRGFGDTAEGNASYSFGDPTKNNFTLELSPSGDCSLKSSRGIDEKEIEVMVDDAIRRVVSGDLGGDVVYQTTMQAKAFTVSPVSMQQFFRILGDQVPITGSRRLSDAALLEFSPELPENPGVPQIFVPQTEIKVTIFVPGPIASALTDRTAAGIAETVGAICALALGRVVEVPFAIFPAEADDARTARAHRYDVAIQGLARDHISLDLFGEFAALGGMDGLMRVRGSLLSYHAALQQASPDVALMLLVSSIEALIVPRPAWRKDKATKRFIKAIDKLCPDVVDTLVNHANVEQAFDYKRRGGPKARRRQLLDQIYMLRSNPTHSGLGLSGAGMLSMLIGPGTMRVALLSDLARGALLEFLQAPRSSLIGHPMVDPVTAAPAVTASE
jgi:hypothetical protein